MLHRSALVLACALFSFSPHNTLHASPSATIGAAVQTWHYDSRTNMVKVRIVNISHRDMTGYNLAIKETYADGHVNAHEMLCDYVGRTVLLNDVKGTADEDSVRNRFGDGLIHPNGVQDEMIPVQPGFKDIEITVDAVAYADGTADVTNNDGLQRMVAHRKADVASLRQASEIAQTALADPNDPDPAATAARKIQDRITVWKAEKHTTLDLDPVALQSVADELKRISSQPGGDKRFALKQYVSKKNEHLAILTPHTDLKVGGPQ